MWPFIIAVLIWVLMYCTILALASAAPKPIKYCKAQAALTTACATRAACELSHSHHGAGHAKTACVRACVCARVCGCV